MTDPLPALPNVSCPVCHALPRQVCTAIDGRPFPQGHREREEATPTHDALTDALHAAPAWDLDAIRATWLQECGACDAGMATTCVCPSGDPRTVILALIVRVEDLEARLTLVRKAARG